MGHVNAPRRCQTSSSSSHQLPCQAAIILCLLGRSVHTFTPPLRRQFLTAEWTLRRRLRGGCGGRAKRRNSGAPAVRELRIPQWCKHLYVKALSLLPFSTNISKNFYFQEVISLVFPVVCISTAPQITGKVEVWGVERSDALRRSWLGFLRLLCICASVCSTFSSTRLLAVLREARFRSLTQRPVDHPPQQRCSKK